MIWMSLAVITYYVREEFTVIWGNVHDLIFSENNLIFSENSEYIHSENIEYFFFYAPSSVLGVYINIKFGNLN